MLHLNEDALRDRPPAHKSVLRLSAEKGPLAGAGREEVAQVPLFLEDQAVNLVQAVSSTPAMPSKLGRADFALWIKTPHGHIHTGDVVYVQSEYPTRPGDHVVVLSGDKVRSVGELTAIAGAIVTIADDGAPQDFPRDAVSVHKIIGVAFP
jgi:SOS-response transcriptional repressor LexA